jgi:hypothetical protein
VIRDHSRETSIKEVADAMKLRGEDSIIHWVQRSYGGGSQVPPCALARPCPQVNSGIYQFCTEIAAYILHLFSGLTAGNDGLGLHSSDKGRSRQDEGLARALGPSSYLTCASKAQKSGFSGQGQGGQRLRGNKARDTAGQDWSGKSRADLVPMGPPLHYPSCC